MTAFRKNSTFTGVFFILATVFGSICALILNPILGAPDYLASIAANQNQVVLGIVLNFAMALCCAGVGFALFPVLRKYSEGFAIGAAGFRIIESVLQILGAIFMVFLLELSREYALAGSPSSSQFQVIGAVIQAGSDWINNSSMLLCWGIAAILYYSLFYQYRLIPRWISLWGLIGIALTIIVGILTMFDSKFVSLQFAFAPIALQEMVMAVWLIVKGFSLPKTKETQLSI
ncbi:MAG: DUF4386 domain-containing protein [Anaerolineae bacterium]|nr:DUF4386 domain-containing protein [Anaerolineae bacterium]